MPSTRGESNKRPVGTRSSVSGSLHHLKPSVPSDLLLLNPKEIDDKRSSPTLVGRNLYGA